MIEGPTSPTSGDDLYDALHRLDQVWHWPLDSPSCPTCENWRRIRHLRRQEAERQESLLRVERYEVALRKIAHLGRCENFTAPPYCYEAGRTDESPYGADRCCDTCIALRALNPPTKEQP